MGYQIYTTTLSEGTYQITSASKIVKISLLGRSATASTFEGNSSIAPPAGFPASAAIPIQNGEKFVDTGTNSGYIQEATITVPAGGSVDVIIEHNP